MLLTLMSYNIKSGLWTERGLDAVAEVIASVNPDIVALQEVDRDIDRSGSIDQPASLGRRLGHHAVFAAAVGGADVGAEGGDYGIAILSRFPIIEHEKLLLFRPDYPAGQRPPWYAEQRCVLGCALDCGGTTVDVFCTHFGLTAEQRLEQAREVAAFVASWHPGRPAVLMGDFNALPDHPEIAFLRGTLTDVFQQCGITGDKRRTFPSGEPGADAEGPWTGGLDYVFLSQHFGDAEIEVLREATPASDHAPVVARVELHP